MHLMRIGSQYSTHFVVRPIVFGFSFTLIVLLTSFSLLAAVVDTTTARQALIVDYDTGAVLLEKNADELMYPSSMSKLMTLYMLFERLKGGRLSLNDTFSVSERAWRMGGSKMFVAINSRVTISDLLRGVIVQSGNDACVVIAENLADNEEAFAQAMTVKAHQIGLQHSTFRNASGWPEPAHVMSARDLSILAKHLIADFPEFYPLFRETDFTYNGIRQGNRNPLLYKPALSADGLKTGHTEEGGYGLVASATRDSRRLIMVLNGLSTMRQRIQESERLIEWAFREFTNVTLFNTAMEVGNADVWLGTHTSVPLVTEQKISVTISRKISKDIKLVIMFNNPIPAPISQGDRLAVLVIETPDCKRQEIPLLAGSTIERLGFFGRLAATTRYLLLGGSFR